jgi:hypothetical protein
MPIERDDTMDYDEISRQQTDPELVAEATTFPTVATGTYIMTVETGRASLPVPDNGDRAPIPGRKMSLVRGRLHDTETRQTVGWISFRMSPDANRIKRADGRLTLDTESALWGQAAKLFGLEYGEVIKGLESTPVLVGVRETFVKIDKTWTNIQHDARSEAYQEEKSELIRKGATPKNYMTAIKGVAG